MIPVTYSGDLSDYLKFLAYFKQELKNAIERGYIGNLVPIEAGKAQYYYNHDVNGWQKEKYDEVISAKYPNWETLSESEKISAPKEMIHDRSRVFLFMFGDGWKEFAMPSQKNCFHLLTSLRKNLVK